MSRLTRTAVTMAGRIDRAQSAVGSCGLPVGAASTKQPPKVRDDRYGPHDYGKHISGDCQCGYYMAQSSSDGPVDPFGPCPMNPKKARTK